MERPKKNFKLTSKKCLTLSLVSALAFTLSATASIAPNSKPTIESYVKADLENFRREKLTDFKAMILKWEQVYGNAAVPAFQHIAKDSAAKDTDRYVAILAMTRVHGAKSGPDLVSFLGDKNWMVRSAALKSVELLAYTPASAKVMEQVSSDPALVIRLQAIDALMRLRPEGTVQALISAVKDTKNYRPANLKKGRADWVPQRALEALRDLASDLKRDQKNRAVALQLLPLLNEAGDGRIRAHALHTIEILEAKSLKPGRPFAERALAWNQALKK